MANLDLVLFRILSIPKHTFIGLGTAPQVALTNRLDQNFTIVPIHAVFLNCCSAKFSVFSLDISVVFFTGYYGAHKN